MNKEHDGLRIFYDVDTQHDFMDRTGALYVPGAEEIKPNLQRLMDYACQNKILLTGSVDKHYGTLKYQHREGELKKEGGPFPDHCMADSYGQKKIEETRLMACDVIAMEGVIKDMNIYVAHSLDDKVNKTELKSSIKEVIMRNKTWSKGGLFFEKQSYDVFTNPAFSEFLKLANVREAVVYGVATDYCVKAAVVGMQKRGIQCYVVTDAIAAVTPETGKSALEEMVNAGAKLVRTDNIIKATEW